MYEEINNRGDSIMLRGVQYNGGLIFSLPWWCWDNFSILIIVVRVLSTCWGWLNYQETCWRFQIGGCLWECQRRFLKLGMSLWGAARRFIRGVDRFFPGECRGRFDHRLFSSYMLCQKVFRISCGHFKYITTSTIERCKPSSDESVFTVFVFI